MKFFIHSVLLILLFTSCQSKTQKLIAKKWDCVKVDNLDPVDTKFQTTADSTVAATMEAALKSLSWTFNNDGTYTTSAADRAVTQGTYEVDDKAKTLVCTTSTQNNSNNYLITILTENEMVLSSGVNGKNIVMHFLPAQ